MNAYADTSFLATLYLTDPRLETSASSLAAVGGRTPLTPLGRLELLNTLQLAAFRRLITIAEAAELVASVKADIAAGILYFLPFPDGVFEQAEALSLSHSHRLGLRSLDILHVATTLALGADTLLTYDRRQAALARAAGLRIRP